MLVWVIVGQKRRYDTVDDLGLFDIMIWAIGNV